MHKLSTRIGANWLVLTHQGVRDPRGAAGVLQHPARCALHFAGDEAEAKTSAIAATVERLNIGPLEPDPSWNVVTTTHWDSRSQG